MTRAALLLLVLLSAPALAQENGEAIPPGRLKADLEQGARLFRKNPSPAAARAYASSLAYADVTFEGKTITVRDPWLTDQAAALSSAAPAQREKIARQIADHLAARAATVDSDVAAAPAKPTPGSTPVDREALLKGILDQSQFHTETEDPKLAQAAATVRERVRTGWNSLKEFVHNLFSGQDQEQSWVDRIKQWITVMLSVLGVVALAWLLFRAVMRATADEARLPGDENLPEAPPRPAEMTLKAAALETEGDLRGAVRALYLALLGELHQQGALAYDRHRTNREYLRTMRLIGDRAAAFEQAVELFDRKWYGREPCHPAELTVFRELVERAGRREAQAA